MAYGQKINQIFANHDELIPNEKVQAAMAEVEANPTDPEKLMKLGIALKFSMYFREAIDVYSTALTYDPFNCLLYRHRGHAYVNIALYKQAAADFEMGLRINPKNWDCWYHLGLSYHLMGEYERAMKAYETCYALAPNDEFRICTADWMCMTLMKMGKIDEMKEVAGRIRPDMVAGESEPYFHRVLAYNGYHTVEEAMAIAEQREDHMFATGSYGLAVYVDKVLGDKARAKEILDKIAVHDEMWSGFAERAAAIDLANWKD